MAHYDAMHMKSEIKNEIENTLYVELFPRITTPLIPTVSPPSPPFLFLAYFSGQLYFVSLDQSQF